MKRKDCFFGLHFDYHANKDTQDIGRYFDEKVLEKIITEVRPDFIQCDTKGHPGYSSYFTKVGNPAPGLTLDLLAEWRKITQKYGVLLFSHYSGVWDMKAMKDHPEWAAVNRDGTLSDKASPFSSYADELLIPQLKELALTYHMDGAWVDGECWAVTPDYRKEALDAFYKEYGLDARNLKTKEETKKWEKFVREHFFSYVNHYITEVKKAAPEFELTSNWMNSAYVPEALTFTDYISGDLSPTNSVDSARYDARVMASFHRNFDVLSWAISYPIHYAKTSIQLSQEAAITLALGGGYQIYNMQSPTHVVMDEWAIPLWKGVSDFCHKMKPFVENSVRKNDLGILYSVDAHYQTTTSAFQRDCEYDFELYGMILAFADNGRSVNVINSQLIGSEDLSSYKTLVVTNSLILEKEVREKILGYLKNGGEVIFEGKDTLTLFANELGISYHLPDTVSPVAMILGEDYALEMRSPYAVIDGAETHLKMKECDVYGDINCWNPPPTISPREEKIPSFYTKKVGKGVAHILPISIGKSYLNDRTFEAKYFVRDCLKECRESDIQMNKPGQVEVILSSQNGETMIHLVNLLGEHRSNTVKTFDNIPPVLNLLISYRCRKPEALYLEPGHEPLEFVYQDGCVRTEIKALDLYRIIRFVS